ncbi:ABC transporter ATP-binding protein [Jiangella alba]|uniref:Carbohydrate ABC transporter ATP-binding protein, CUT1 family n=1 Tax=Jiangella alba TaxID=561176 RepID=A0A1H5PP34_9ACTN|nr:ABC transporter ATP-binding protein [Jiangella alba]SEF15580.1 carbohydrate ABC transporter ATP-binding protein, CUT1 family [Jiangella alba]
MNHALRSDTPPATEPGTSTGPAIELVGLRRDYGDTAAVDGIDLSVPVGSFLVLLGPSGCGKTTTLRMLAGLESPTGGEIRLGGRTVASGQRGVTVPPGRRGAGLVFQSYALWPHMTVRRNVEWPLKIAKLDKARRTQRAADVLRLLDIAELAGRYPGEISGGQQQRVAIARMLAPEPAILLFDEPLSNLDAKLRVETRAELLRIHRATGATSVYVTHDQVEAMTMASHVALMRHGRIEQFGSPADLLRRPASAFVAAFVGTPPANVLAAVVARGRFQRDGVDLGPSPLPDGTAVRLMYRAESLTLDPAGALEIEVIESSPLAGRWLLSGTSGGDRVTVVEDEEPTAALGSLARVRVPDRPDAVFDPGGARMETA